MTDTAYLLFAQADTAAEGSGFLDILFSGGWPGLLILVVLLALSVTAAYLVFDSLMTLRHSELLPEGLADSVRGSVAAGRWKDADAACRAQPSMLAFVLTSGLSEVEFGWPQVEKAMEEALAEQAARLMRRIEYLSVIGNIAPMVGLLGTVVGMIFAFQQVATHQGAAGAADLAEGIYSALVTTVGGLLVAIPSLGAFAIFRNRVDGFVAEAGYTAAGVFAPLKRRAGRRLATPPGAAANPHPAPPVAEGGKPPRMS